MAEPPLPFGIHVLGSGTTTPHHARQTAAYVVQVGEEYILFDSGSGTLGRLGAMGLTPHQMQAFFYTHLHLDHVGDLFPLLFSMAAKGPYKRERPLSIRGPQGFQAYFDHQCEVFGRWVLDKGFEISTSELRGGGTAVDLGNCTVSAFRMRHSAVALGYRVETPDGRRIAYTGDADSGAELVDLLEGADVAVIDCSAMDDQKIPGHLSPTPIAEACVSAGVKSIVLSHFYPPLADDPDPAVAQVAQLSGLPTTAAYDGAYFPTSLQEPQ